MPPKLSIVISAYNEEALLPGCIEAVLRSLHNSSLRKGESEVIVVNNASTDRTKEIASSFSDVVVVDEPRKGLTRARQAGFIASRGELIANLDADTLMPEGWLETVLTTFTKDPELVLLSGPYIYYDLPLLLRSIWTFFYRLGYWGNMLSRIIMRSHTSLIQGGNFVLRRNALEKIEGFNTTIEFYGEDVDIAKRLMSVGKVLFTFQLPMYSSGRRIAKEGVVTMGLKYGLNWIWVMATGRPFSIDYIDIRGGLIDKKKEKQ